MLILYGSIHKQKAELTNMTRLSWSNFRCGGFAIRHLLLSGFVIRFDFIIKILFNNGNVQQTFLPSIVYRWAVFVLLWWINNLLSDRILMDVVDFLTQKFLREYLLWTVTFLPESIVFYFFIVGSCVPKPVHHPVLSTFMHIVLDAVYQFLACELFEIPNYIWQLKSFLIVWHFVVDINQQMKVVAHHYPSIYSQAFVFLAIAKWIYDNVFIYGSGKDINPIDNCQSDKVDYFC